MPNLAFPHSVGRNRGEKWNKIVESWIIFRPAPVCGTITPDSGRQLIWHHGHYRTERNPSIVSQHARFQTCKFPVVNLSHQPADMFVPETQEISVISFLLHRYACLSTLLTMAGIHFTHVRLDPDSAAGKQRGSTIYPEAAIEWSTTCHHGLSTQYLCCCSQLSWWSAGHLL